MPDKLFFVPLEKKAVSKPIKALRFEIRDPE
jgi:hypothetical protein